MASKKRVYPIHFLPIASEEMEAAYSWYERERAGLGESFITEAEQALKRIEQTPDSFPVAKGAIRRKQIRRFPYSLYYLLKSDCVVVIACFHHKRNPTIWQDRE